MAIMAPHSARGTTAAAGGLSFLFVTDEAPQEQSEQGGKSYADEDGREVL